MKALKISFRNIVLLSSFSLVACGGKPNPAPSPSTDVRAFESADRAKLLLDLSVDLKMPVTVGDGLGYESEFFVNNALRALDKNRDRVRAQSNRIEAIVLGSSYGQTVNEKTKRITLTVSVKSPADEILGYIETRSRDYARVQALETIREKTGATSVSDILGLKADELTSLTAALEQGLKGFDLKKERMGLVIAERSAIILRGKDKPGALIVKKGMTSAEISTFATESLVAVKSAESTLALFRSSVGYDFVLQEGEFNAAEVRKVLDLVSTLRVLNGVQLTERSELKRVVIGRRMEASSSTDKAKPLQALVDFEATPSAIIDFLRSMPMTFIEEQKFLVAEIRASLDTKLGLKLTLSNESRMGSTKVSDAELATLRSAGSKLLQVLSPERKALLKLSEVALEPSTSGYYENTTLSAGVLKVYLRDDRLSALEAFIADEITKAQELEARERCTLAHQAFVDSFASLVKIYSDYGRACAGSSLQTIALIERVAPVLREGLDAQLVKELGLQSVEIRTSMGVPVAYPADSKAMQVDVSESAKVTGAMIREALEKEKARRRKVIETEIVELWAKIARDLSRSGTKVEVADKSGTSWTPETVETLRTLVKSVFGAIDATTAEKIGLKKVEVVPNGVATTWVKAEGKLAIPADLKSSEDVKKALATELDAIAVAKAFKEMAGEFEYWGNKVEVKDKSGVKWSSANVGQIGSIGSYIREGLNTASGDRGGANLGLKKIEIVSAGVAVTWVQSEKKLVVPENLASSEKIVTVVAKEMSRRAAAGQ